MLLDEAVDYTLAIPYLYETLVGGSQTTLPQCGASGAMQYLNIQFYSKTSSVRIPNIPNSFVSGSFYEIPFSIPYPGDGACLQFNDIPLTLIATCEITPIRGSPVYQYGYASSTSTEISYLQSDRIYAQNSSAAFDVSWSASSGQTANYDAPASGSLSGNAYYADASKSPSYISTSSGNDANSKLETLILILIGLVASLIFIILSIGLCVACAYMPSSTVKSSKSAFDVEDESTTATSSLFASAYKSLRRSRSTREYIVYPGSEESTRFRKYSVSNDQNNFDALKSDQSSTINIVSPGTIEGAEFGVFKA